MLFCLISGLFLWAYRPLDIIWLVGVVVISKHSLYYFVKLFVHFAGHFRETRAEVEASALGFYRPKWPRWLQK